jgi:hypothetical protein
MEMISHSDSERLSWQVTHENLTRIAKKRAEVDAEEAVWLIRGMRERLHVHLGYGSYLEYLERTFGYDRKVGLERIRVAHALEELPRAREALRTGTMKWSALREMTRVAVPSTEAEWLEACAGKSVREVEDLVTGLRPGDGPKAVRSDELVKKVLRFEVGGETFALFRDAREALELEVGHALSDEDVLGLLARRALGRTDEPEKAAFQIAMTVCEGCGKGWRDSGGERVPVKPETVEAARCDAEEIGNPSDPRGATKRATRTIPPSVKRAVARRDGGRCIVPGCRSTKCLEAHHLDPLHEGGTHDPDRMGMLCWAHHRGAHNGTLIIEGRVSTGLSFLHADGSSYGAATVDAKVSSDVTLLFGALKKMGFTDSEARLGAEAAKPHVGAGLETALVKALAAIPILMVKEEEATYGTTDLPNRGVRGQ